MIKSSFVFENYKTIGIEKPEELLIGSSLGGRPRRGGLLVLIGQNNSGKSNILKGIKAFFNNSISASDTPHFLYSNDIVPKITYRINFGTKTTDFEYTKSVNSSQFHFPKDVSIDNFEAEVSTAKEYIRNRIKMMTNMFKVARSRGEPAPDTALDKEFYSVLSAVLTDAYLVDFQKNKEVIERILPFLRTSLFVGDPSTTVDEIKRAFETLFKYKVEDFYFEHFKNQFGFDFLPEVIEYSDDANISPDDLHSDITSDFKMANPKFFKQLFALFSSYGIDTIEEAYKRFEKSHRRNLGLLASVELKVNEILLENSIIFNQMYTGEKNPRYRFEVRLLPGRIDFIIKESDEFVFLENQSSGFIWFFNFYFSVLASQDLSPGSIILLDEPATHLHVIGQIELQKLLQDFASIKEINIIMCTHSPFFISVDYLDQIRIVSKEKISTSVTNKFTLVSGSNINVIFPIRSALTVSRHILVNPDVKTVFVEGVTDYNYFVAFKLLFSISNIQFLPFQGANNNKIYDELKKICRDPILLVDSDATGIECKKNAMAQGIKAFELGEIVSGVMEIENMFSPDDYLELDEYLKKGYLESSIFKTDIRKLSKKIKPETKNNFKKIFNFISKI